MNQIAGLARDARKTQMATWLMGLAIFFDDYANTILVGSTMRPLSDRFKVAREKLAYIVDSTAAPVAGVSILSTWIAFEVSTFSAQLPDAGLAPADGYAVFLQTLPFRFYSWFTLIFVGLNVFTGRDFGPMLAAERRARAGKVLRRAHPTSLPGGGISAGTGGPRASPGGAESEPRTCWRGPRREQSGTRSGQGRGGGCGARRG
jgi:Na+/H+ antiporter NhaC